MTSSVFSGLCPSSFSSFILPRLYLITLIASSLTAAQQTSLQQQQSSLVRISALNVQCGDTSMTVDIQFSAPFQGVIFSKGYFSHYECVYVRAGDSQTQYRFVIPYDGCGTTAGGTALNTDGRPAQFLRSIDNVVSAEASTMQEDKLPGATSTTDNTTASSGGTLIVVDSHRARRAVADAADKNITITLSEDSVPELSARSLDNARYISGRQLPMSDFQGAGGPGGFGGGMRGDPNAQEFINMNNVLNNDNGNGGQISPQQQAGIPVAAMFNQNPNDNFRFQQQRQPGVNENFFSPPPQQQAQVPVQQRPPVVLPTGFVYPPSAAPPVQSNLQQRQQPVRAADSQSTTIFVQPQQQTISSPPAAAQTQQLQSIDVLQAAASEFQPRQQLPKGVKFMENVLIIQFDANIQEVWDVAKALRCEWHDNYHKRVTYKPMNVGTLDVVEAAFAGDNIGVWMTVQQGQGPFAPEVNGIVRIGQQLTLTIGIQDPSKQFDMRVLNCVASDGSRPTIQLVDEYGCVVRPKIMAPFQKARNVGPQSSVVSYATFQAFKFPDSVDVNIECSVEVCKHGCPRQCFAGEGRQQRADGDVAELAASESRLNVTLQQLPVVNLTRTRRQVDDANNQVGVTRKFKVVSMNDMAPFFEALRAVNNMNNNNTDSRKSDDEVPTRRNLANERANVLCISPSVFIGSIIMVSAALIVIVLVFVFLCTKFRRTAREENRTFSKAT